jgi:hypothetical protein
MKKYLLLLSALSLFFIGLQSCKNKTPETAPVATEVVETPAQTTEPAVATEIVSSIEVPNFEAPEAKKFCDDYKALMGEYASLKGTGDNVKAAELSKKFMSWANGASALAGKLKPEEMKTFNDFMVTAEAKFNEMNSAVAK